MAAPIGNFGNVGGNNQVNRKNVQAKSPEAEVSFNDGFQSSVSFQATPELNLSNVSSQPASVQIEQAPVHPEVAEMYSGMLSGHLPVEKSELKAFETGILGLGVIAEVNQVGEALGPKGSTLGVETNGINSTAFFGLSGRQLT